MKAWILLLAIVSTAHAKTQTSPLGNPDAKQGGTFYQVMRKEPATLNYFSGGDLYGIMVNGYILDSLLNRDPDTNEWIPGLAEAWEISKDGKQFTFTLRAGATFQDGKPVTVEDVKFSYDAIMNPAFGSAALRPYYEDLEKCEIVDAKTIRFTAKEKYFRNFDSAAGLAVVPKHLYSDPEKTKKIMNTNIVGSGPYMMDTFDRGNRIVLKRNPNWWGRQDPRMKGLYNYDRIWFRYQAQDNLLIEMIKKGTIDFIDDQTVTPEMYEKNAVGPEWGKAVLKKKVENKSPKPYSFVGWNLRNPMFQDKGVRKALTHLMNRQMMIEKFRYKMSVPATGPLSVSSEYASQKVTPLAFDPKKAASLLAQAGWADTDKDGILDKVIDGKKTPFSFTLLYAAADREKYYTIYKEDLKKAGIQMDLKLVEWNTLHKLRQEKKFDAITLGWGGGGVDWDPKQIWHSESDSENGSNFIGYKNPEVDKLIDQAREELDKAKRIKLLHKVYEQIAEDAPYVFMFNDKYNLYMHTNRIGQVKPTFKFGLFPDSWWIL